MQERSIAPAAVLGVLVALGFAIGGYFVGEGFRRGRSSDRFVTVKGLAEREVPANLALWPIVFTVTADDLAALQRAVDENAGKIHSFLGDTFRKEEVSLSMPRITDREAMGLYQQGRQLERYVAEATVTLRTSRIDAVRTAMERSGELVKQGVALIRSYEYNTQYLYTDLEKIKPEMIAEATRDARRAAEQFAEDSGSRVGAIRKAQQGYFVIEDRDPFSPEFKKIRVVTTIEYFLVDD
ncbi:MAG: SIMPL domain-containing protein [Acidobacteriota bacterium]|nr:MAG: SIMPL domain-containing protein [Acidobacteriota bacterium]